MDQFHSSIKLINGIKLHVIEAGPKSGKLIIFLHGFPEFWYSWAKYIPFFSQKGYKVVVPDQRGYNLSDKPGKISDYSISLLVQDIICLIASYNRKKAVIVSHDWGALVAWSLSIYYPQFIEKVVICNVPHPDVFFRYASKNMSQFLRSWYILFFQIPRLPEFLVRLANYRAFKQVMQTSTYRFTKKEMNRYLQAWQQENALKGMINWYRAIRFQPAQLKPNNVDIPVLLIWGKKDLALESNMAQLSIDKCTNGKLIYFPDATHWVHHEKKNQVRKLIFDFINNNRTSSKIG